MLLMAFSVHAQTRSREIAATWQHVDGISLGVQPGDTLFLMAGERREVRFDNLTGTEKKPVIIINKGGKVVIRTRADYGILFENSVHFVLTGTGSKDMYGIEIAASGNHGLAINEFSSYCEAGNLEIHDVGYAGITAKTDPNCTRKDLRYFIMKHLSFHHNLIYNTGSEGFYIGFSWYPARRQQCGADSLLYSHQIHGLRIYNNIIRNTNAEAIQCGCATKDVKIYGNTVFNYGVTNGLWQNHGVQIKAGTTGDFFNNIVSTGTGDGISYYGNGGNRVYHNLLVNTGGAAIYHNDTEAMPGRHFEITDNTILFPRQYGVTVMSQKTTGNILKDNVIITDTLANAINGIVQGRWDSSGNRIYTRKDRDVTGKRYDTATYLISKIFPFESEPSTDMRIELKPVKGTYTFSAAGNNTLILLYNNAGLLQPSVRLKRNERMVTADLSAVPKGIYYVSEILQGKALPVRRIIKI